MLDFDAGKYAAFVWPAYGLTIAMFVLMIVSALLRAHRWRKAVQRQEKDKAP